MATLHHAPSPKSNTLLAALAHEDYLNWQAHLELSELPLGKVLYESGSVLSHVFFPTTAIVSLLQMLEDGHSTEIAVVGYEGVTGIAALLGGNSSTRQAVVQSSGYGYRIKSSFIKSEIERSTAVMRLFMRYAQALITQISQTAVCNRHHTLDQQLSRWLLLSLDRLSGDELNMTQELIANMLGVRREGVTQAAGHLQAAGVIQYTRGRIKVVNRAALETRSCECYEVVKKEYDRLLPHKHTT